MKTLPGPTQGLYHRPMILAMDPKATSTMWLWGPLQHRPALTPHPHPSTGQRAAAGHIVLLSKFWELHTPSSEPALCLICKVTQTLS